MAIDQPPAPDSAEERRRREALVAAALAALLVLAQRRAEGELTEVAWVAAVRAQLAAAHLTAAALARGGWDALDRETLDLVGKRLATQFEYLDAFAADVAGKDFGASAMARLQQYGGAAVRGTFSAVVRQSATADGHDEELNVLGSSNSCEECPGLSDQGWVPIGTLPEIGERACYGNCACTIVTRSSAEAEQESAA